jgi:hypothetical protein
VDALLRALDRGGRTIGTLLLLDIAALPFTGLFIAIIVLEPPFPLAVASFALLATLLVPWLGFVFPRILRLCWRREQVWPGARATAAAVAMGDGARP